MHKYSYADNKYAEVKEPSPADWMSLPYLRAHLRDKRLARVNPLDPCETRGAEVENPVGTLIGVHLVEEVPLLDIDVRRRCRGVLRVE